jgi:hypothetical protein
MSEPLHCPAVLALELAGAARPERLTLSRAEAAELGALVSTDLVAWSPEITTAHLVLSGALFDSAQLLRPGWPVFAEMSELAHHAVAANAAGQVIAFGGTDDTMPSPLLTPDRRLAGGAMLFVPWLLSGGTAAIERLGERMERDFANRGQAGTRTADFLMRTLGTRFEHARYLTRHDLCALASVQLEHAGLGAFWQMLEAALFSPRTEETVLSSRGRTLHYRHGRVATDLPGFERWLDGQGTQVPPAARAQAYAGWLFELRQFAALCDAHALPFAVGTDDIAIAHLDAPDPALPPPRLYAHEAPGLGVVVVSAAQSQPSHARMLAHGWPAARYGAAGPLHRLGRIVLDPAAAALAVPPESLH